MSYELHSQRRTTGFCPTCLCILFALGVCNSNPPRKMALHHEDAMDRRQGGACIVITDASDIPGIDTTMAARLRIFPPDGVVGVSGSSDVVFPDDFGPVVARVRELTHSYNPALKTVVIRIGLENGSVPAARLADVLKLFRDAADQCLPEDERLVIYLSGS